jgi:hypothetical protein
MGFLGLRLLLINVIDLISLTFILYPLKIIS